MPQGNHTLLLTTEGSLLSFGNNSDGQLGLGHKHNQTEAMVVPWGGARPFQVDWGLRHSLVLDEAGVVWEAGQSISLTFQQVPELPSITVVAAGYTHSAALDTNNAGWVWRNHATCYPWASTLPKRVEDLPPVLKVACGMGFLVVETEEALWVLGCNTNGQLGLDHMDPVPQFTRVEIEGRPEGPLRSLTAFSYGILIVDSKGSAWSTGDNSHGQLGRNGNRTVFGKIEGLPPLKAAASGGSHNLALDTKGGVWVWGRGQDGQLGTNTSGKSTPTHVPLLNGTIHLMAALHHSLAFHPNGGLYLFGWNLHGQLGLLHTTDQGTPTLSPYHPAPPAQPRNRQKSARSAIEYQ